MTEASRSLEDDDAEEEVRLENEHCCLTVYTGGSLGSPHGHHFHSGPRWTFVSKANPTLGIHNTSLVELTGSVNGYPWKAFMSQYNVEILESELEMPNGIQDFGPKIVTLASVLPKVGQVFIDFALSSNAPSLILRLRCPSTVCKDEFKLEGFVLFDGDAEVSQMPRSNIKSYFRSWWDYIFRKPGPRRVFMNGWNAWSFTGAVQQGDRPPAPGMPGVFSAAFHHGAGPADYDRGTKELSSEMFALLSDKERGTGLLLGFLSQHNQFGAFSFDASLVEVGAHCHCDGQLLPLGASILSDWCLIELQTFLPEQPLISFMDRAALVNQSLLLSQQFEPQVADTDQVPVGWCSWYHFYENISETNLLQNVTMMANLREKLPLQLFQIDDGYQRAWGDWLTLDDSKFPTKSMRDLVNEVRAQGLRPGLWLAPVAADKHSQIAADHPEWIIRQKNSEWAANSANCGKWFYGLDVTIPAVQEYIQNTLTTVSHGAWSFDYLKLDFLYAAALKGKRQDPTLNTAQVLQLTMRLIRRSVGPSTFILGCGAPLGATIGWVNANRVSADAGPAWLPVFPLPGCKWNLPCARNMVRNTINRLPMHGRWWINDPDCMLLRESTQFTWPEVIGIATVKALSGGSFLVSDDLGSVSESRMRVAQSLLPVLGKAAVALDLLDREIPEVLRLYLHKEDHGFQDEWILVALCNWEDSVKTTSYSWSALLRPLLCSGRLHSQPLALHILEFWSSDYTHVFLDLDRDPHAHFQAADLPPHSAKLFAIRIDHSNDHSKPRPQFLGSNAHFSCGWELQALHWKDEESGGADNKKKEEHRHIQIKLDAGKVLDGSNHSLWLSLPDSQALETTLAMTGLPSNGSEKKIPIPAPCGEHGGLHHRHHSSSLSETLTHLTGGGHQHQPPPHLSSAAVWKIPFPQDKGRFFEWNFSYPLPN